MPKKPESPCSYPGSPDFCYGQYCDDRNNKQKQNRIKFRDNKSDNHAENNQQ